MNLLRLIAGQPTAASVRTFFIYISYEYLDKIFYFYGRIMANSDSLFSDLELYGGEGYVPYESKDPLNDPKSFTFRYKVINICVLI